MGGRWGDRPFQVPDPSKFSLGVGTAGEWGGGGVGVSLYTILLSPTLYGV